MEWFPFFDKNLFVLVLTAAMVDRSNFHYGNMKGKSNNLRKSGKEKCRSVCVGCKVKGVRKNEDFLLT